MVTKKIMIYSLLLCYYSLSVDLELMRAYKNPRVRAFLDMIAFAEGTHHDLGYRTQFTGTFFYNFKDHPRQRICGYLKGKEICSTAAGRYQFLAKTWDEVAPRIDACNFGPMFQDYAAIELIRQNEALKDIQDGKIGKAIKKLNKVWASFPGAPYGQPTKSIAELKAIFMERLRAHYAYKRQRFA